MDKEQFLKEVISILPDAQIEEIAKNYGGYHIKIESRYLKHPLYGGTDIEARIGGLYRSLIRNCQKYKN